MDNLTLSIVPWLKNTILGGLLFFGSWAFAQAPVMDIDLVATEVISQGQTGTCWSFCTTSFLESEAHRVTGELHDFSEMASVRVIYSEKVERYVRHHGHHQFGPGGLSHDVTHAAAVFGILPASVYDGGSTLEGHDHGALDRRLASMAKKLVKKSKGMAPADFAEVEATLDAVLGALPNTFDYRGVKYSPESFRDAMGIDPMEYASLSSFTHHPFGQSFVLEVPDNHAQGEFFNVPLDELEDAVHSALERGFTVAWDADVSNAGFSFNDGWAVMPEAAETREEWGSLGAMPLEPSVDQAMRQAAFDSQENTDDHLMHIIGRATDAKGRQYFVIKNSWGQGNGFGGKQFVSTAYFRHHTIGIMVHEDGLQPEIRQQWVR